MASLPDRPFHIGRISALYHALSGMMMWGSYFAPMRKSQCQLRCRELGPSKISHVPEGYWSAF